MAGEECSVVSTNLNCNNYSLNISCQPEKLTNFVTWNQALFSFCFVNNILMGKAKQKESLIQTVYKMSTAGLQITASQRTLPVKNRWVRTKHGPGASLDQVHGPLSWTGSMDPMSWTRSMDSFFYFYKKVLHQVHGHSKIEIVPKKDFTRRCQPMLTIDHKYLVVLTWRILCLHMCSCKTVKLS